MSAVGSGEEQSEDGELQSPVYDKNKEEAIDFSLSEEDGEAMDGLDIKPPQARFAQKSKRSREGHERSSHHKRDRHRSERHLHREKHHHREKSRSGKDREGHSSRDKERYYSRELQNYEQYKETYVDAQYATDRSYRERKDESRSRQSDRKHEEKKSRGEREEKHKSDRYDEDKRADKALNDLRQRLLSKRTVKDEEYVEVMSDSGRGKRYKSSKMEVDEEYVEREVKKEKDRERWYKKHESAENVVFQGEAGAYVKEIIDMSTGDEQRVVSRRDRNEDRESKEERELTKEQELRREKLLEAEREMARLKEQSRLERERRHLERATKRKQEEESHYNKRLRTDEAIVDLSGDNSESEQSQVEEEEEPSKHEGSASERSDSSSNRSRNRHKHRNRSPSRSSHRSEESHGNSESEHSDRSKTKSRSRSRSKSNSSRKSESSVKDMEEDKESEKTEAKEEKPQKNPVDENLPPYYPAIQGCRSVVEFQSLNRIEEGTYGVVYRARDKRTDEIVALKRLKMEKEKEGFPITSLREINTLLKGQHPNIVTVREIVVGSNMDKIYIVMDYVEHDLKSLMETMRHKKQNFMPGEVKCLLRQLLLAVAHLHDNWILHRDLKTSNLLLSHKGILKVGDFGLAREYGSPLKAYTPIVVTLWYRAPELLLCTKEYSTPIDMWSVGCIFAELLLMNALFPGKSEVDQLNRIFKDLGTPNETIWKGFKDLPAVKKMKFTEYPVSNLRAKFNTLSEMGLGLLIDFLTYDPEKRITAEKALQHRYFDEPPLPIDPAMFPTWPAKSELGQKRALAASPKPPSAGGEFKKLGEDMDDGYGFRIGMGLDHRRSGPGFNLKF